MILRAEVQEKIINEYLMQHTVDQTKRFIDGMEATIKLINKIKQDQRENEPSRH